MGHPGGGGREDEGIGGWSKGIGKGGSEGMVTGSGSVEDDPIFHFILWVYSVWRR